jgi:hypothetical protein
MSEHLKLVVRAFISVVVVSRIQWVRSSKRVVDLGRLILNLPLLNPFIIATPKAFFIAVVFIFVIPFSITAFSFLNSSSIFAISSIEFFIAVKKLIHLVH